MKLWLWDVLIALDKFANALLWPLLNRLFATPRFGDSDETLSSVFGKELRAGNRRVRWVCRVLHWFDRKHCWESIDEEDGRA